MKLLTKDRDNYKLLYEQTRHDRGHSHSPAGKVNIASTELDIVREERDALRGMLRAKEQKGLYIDKLTSRNSGH